MKSFASAGVRASLMFVLWCLGSGGVVASSQDLEFEIAEPADRSGVPFERVDFEDLSPGQLPEYPTIPRYFRRGLRIGPVVPQLSEACGEASIKMVSDHTGSNLVMSFCPTVSSVSFDVSAGAAALDSGGFVATAFDDDGNAVSVDTSSGFGCHHLTVVASEIRSVRVDFASDLMCWTPEGFMPCTLFRIDDISFQPTTEVLRYTAFGDSFSSGEGSPPYRVDLNGDGDTGEPGENTDLFQFNSCHRSNDAYPRTIFRKPSLLATEFPACSGATTANLVEDGQGQYFAPDDVPQSLRGTDRSCVATVTIGGNDAGFAEVLKACLKEEGCQESFPELEKALRSSVKEAIREALDDIDSAEHRAQKFVLGYPMLFPSAGSSCAALTDPPQWIGDPENGWDPAEQRWMNRMTAVLNEEIREVVDDIAEWDVQFVPVTEHFRGHALCENGSWFRGPSVPVSLDPQQFHPNTMGHRLGYRKALEAAVEQFRNGSATDASGFRSAATPPEESASGKTEEPSFMIVPLQLSHFHQPACAAEPFTRLKSMDVRGSGFPPSSPVTVEIYAQSPEPHLFWTGESNSKGELRFGRQIPSSVPDAVPALIKATGQDVSGNRAVGIAAFNLWGDLGQIFDADQDGIEDLCDVCPETSDPEQTDTDLDGLGDACDPHPTDPGNDVDRDGLGAASDPCPLDPTNDADGDSLCGGIDNCGLVFNPDQMDTDLDGFGDACDPCPGNPEPSCLFTNGFESGDTSAWSGS